MPELLDRLKTALADRYALHEELGAGGMATVYLADDLKHDRKVAVKVLRPELAVVLGAERFVQEIKTTLSDRYAIEREVGSGGMATVYLAEDLKHHRKVAVKVLRPELAAVLGPERFVQEIKTTANLQHPHILPLFDSGSSPLGHLLAARCPQ